MKKAFLLFLMAVSQIVFAQTGLPRFASIQNGSLDNINLYNLNVEFRIPVISTTGRGFTFDPGLVYNSTVYVLNGSNWSPDPSSNFGWLRQAPAGTVTFSYQKLGCYANDGTHQWEYRYYNYVLTEPNGTKHPFGLDFRLPEAPQNYPECTDGNPTTGYAKYGYFIDARIAGGAGGGGPDPRNVSFPKAWAPAGPSVTNASISSDTNGNSTNSTVVNSNETDWSDSSGRVALKVINNTTSNPNTTQYQYPDNSGSWNTVTVTMTLTTVTTAFSCTNPVINNYSGSVQLPTSVSLPNGTSYSFTYDTAGRLTRITFPTGGYIQYAYGSVNCADGTPLSLTRTVNDGTTSSIWTYTRTKNGTVWQTVVTAPLYNGSNNDTRYTFDTYGFDTKVENFQGSVATGTLLQTVDTTRAPDESPDWVTTTIAGKQKRIQYDWGGGGLLSDSVEYDWGLVGPVRTTLYSYNGATSGNPVRMTRTAVYDGNSQTGTLRSATDYIYDEANTITNCPTGVPNHDDVKYGCTSTAQRGNLTTMKQYADVSGGGASPIVTTFTYDSLGNLLTQTVDGMLQSTSAYSSTTNYSQPDSVTVGPAGTQLTTAYTYNQYTGLPATITDPNNGLASFLFDNMYRTTKITRPDQKIITIEYADSENKTTVASPLDSARTLSQISWVDGLGRSVKVQTPIGTTESKFDSLGRPSQASNPYTNGGSTSYWTTTNYDPLGRVISVVTPDNSSSTLAYSSDTNNGYIVTTTDPAGKQNKNVYDGLGRLTSVYEPDVNNGNVLTVQTSYTYTALNSLMQVTQGQQTRNFTYDGLNRVKSVQTPEAGTVSYSYSGCSKDPSNVCSRTDARNVITSYTYDGLNRPYQVTYNVSGATGVPATPTVVYSYGTSTTSCNNGRMTEVTDGSHSETYTYNLLGNVLSVAKTLSGQTYTTQYGYNDAGLATQVTYPSGMYVTQVYDNTGQLQSITDNSGKQYASGLAHNAAGQITGFAMGLSGGTVTAALGYSPQLYQLASLSYATTTKTLFSLTYGYGAAQNTNNTTNNGQITKITDGVDNGRTATYGYDALSRLTTFSTVPGSPNYPSQTMSWTYDRYGNRQAQVLNGTAQTLNPSATTNRLNLTYDSGGNLLNDGTYGFTWDAENRMTSYAGNSVVNEYDGNGLRVRRTKSGGSDVIYIFAASLPIAEYATGAAPSNPSVEYVYLGSQLIGSRKATSVDVRFTNDSCSGCGGTPVGGGDRNLFVNNITVGSTTILPGDSSVGYVNAPCNGSGGLYCNGDMTATTASSGTSITVNSYGSPDYSIYPHMQVYVNGVLQGEWDVTGAAQNYTVNIPSSGAGYTFYERDHLSIRAILADATPNSPTEQGHLPFGEQWYGDPSLKWRFTSYERDSDIGDDFASNRRYQFNFGRFSSPDPIAGDPGNPQSWNRYTYVLNNPTGLIDPSGMDCIYFNDDGTISNYLTGDCGSINDDGYYVNGTVDWSSLSYNDQTHTLGYDYTSYDGNISAGLFTNYVIGSIGSFPMQVLDTQRGPANNGPTWSQKNKTCLDKINSTPDGKFYNFFSPLSMIPGIGPEWQSSIAEDVGGGAAKYVAFKFFQGAGTNWAGTGLGVIGKTVSGTIEGVAEGVLAPVAAAATVGQLTVHAGCAISAAF